MYTDLSWFWILTVLYTLKKKVKADKLRRGWVGEGLIIFVSHNVPNNIAGTFELKKLTDVGESFCESEQQKILSN